MKKVVLAAYACSPHMGSEENLGWNWATGLAQKGYEVWCVTSTMGQHNIEALGSNLDIENLHFNYVALPFGLNRLLLNPRSKRIYLHYLIWRWMAAKVVQRMHKKHLFEVAHHVTYGSMQQGSCLYKVQDCKLIFGPVGGGQMAMPIFKEYFEKKWIWERVRKKVSDILMRYSSSLQKTLKQATTILTANQETKVLLGNYYPMFLQKTHMATDIALPREYEDNIKPNKSKDGVLKILWLGTLIPRKGLKLSLEALSQVHTKVRYELTIVGDGEQEQKIDQWVKAFGLDPAYINRVGTIPFDQLKEYYIAADVLLFCSLRDTTGSQIIEAMAFGVPVIVFNSSGAAYVVPDDCGIKINPVTKEQSINDMARAIEKMANTELRLKLGNNAYKNAMNYSWDKKIDAITKKFY
ncbi:glycosyltransferase family 4 protein [uncultured Kriegella sp.]|uniref:glycosyltransferase family 4 protein n=1 Tax=uncultured Kriegella sp. TaxID=1798910 RepID=UPI0030DB028F|tara:strand:- start:8734 stop:9960 length:1227 start_codon:yes stop_codon:yes gene_type:complete